MTGRILRPITPWIIVLCLIAGSVSCEKVHKKPEKLTVPTGYYATLDITLDNRMYRFGPFVGYYFRPKHPTDMSRLDFLCYNEQSFYTHDLPADTLLFKGDAVLTTLPAQNFTAAGGEGRIRPVFKESIPQQWKETRPETQEEYRHFHSAHNEQGAAMTGYWLRHIAKEEFIYDMGGRVRSGSPLYHKVTPGIDLQFPFIVEFDHGQQ